MKLNCPECQSKLDESYLCAKGHQFLEEDGVLILLNQQTQVRLYDWLKDFEDFRKSKIEKLDFENLPQSGLKVNRQLWQARTEDLKIVSKLLKSNPMKILDIGSWNGWLSNQLCKKGHEVVAIDYFIDENDGLKAKNHYKNPDWKSIQMNLIDLSVFSEKFDLIVFNRCFAYFDSQQDIIAQAKKNLSSTGQILITGMNVQTSQKEAKELTESKKIFKEKYGKELLFNPSKGYLEYENIDWLISMGFEVKANKNLKNILKSKFAKHKQVCFYGHFINS